MDVVGWLCLALNLIACVSGTIGRKRFVVVNAFLVGVFVTLAVLERIERRKENGTLGGK